MNRPLLLLVFFPLLLSCRREVPVQELPDSLEPDFVDFYGEFHQDSVFQLDHIIFPLQGLPAEVDSVTLADDRFFWQKEDWILHRPLDAGDQDFQRIFTPLNKDLIVEKIVHKQTGFGMMRRWARMGDEWYLIYYAGMNRLADPGEKERVRIEGGF